MGALPMSMRTKIGAPLASAAIIAPALTGHTGVYALTSTWAICGTTLALTGIGPIFASQCLPAAWQPWLILTSALALLAAIAAALVMRLKRSA